MSYEILQFNLGTGHAQGYVLHGLGEHEGTNLSLGADDFHHLIAHEQMRLELLFGWRAPPPLGLLNPSPAERALRDEQFERLRLAVASRLDSLFQLRHAERLFAAQNTSESECHRNEQSE